MNAVQLSGAPVERLGWVLVHSLWEFFAVMAVALVADWLMRRAAAATRHVMFLAALGAIVAAPAATWLVLSGPTVTAVAGNAPDVPELAPAPADLPTVALQPREPAGAAPSEAARASRAIFLWETAEGAVRPWLATIVAAWCVGVVGFSVRPLVGWRTVQRLRHVGASAVPPEIQVMFERAAGRIGLRRPVRLLQSTLVATPVVVGWIRPVVLVPLSVMSGLPAPQLEAILLHELAHVRRHDYLVNLLQTLVETAFFYHPAVWWLSRKLRAEREHCCDDAAVAATLDRVEYGRALLALEELRGAEPALAVGAGGSSLVPRVRRVVGLGPARDGAGGALIGTLAAIGAAAVLLAAFAGDAARAGGLDEAPWGEPSGGLRARVLAVASDTDEQHPDVRTAKRPGAFARPEDLTLLVELKNAGDRPLLVQGTRYGDSVSRPWPGKSVSDLFGPHLFSFEFVDGMGRAVMAPSATMLDADAMLTLSSGRAETLKPGESLAAVLRPAKWDPTLARALAAGDYKVRVHYRGLEPGVLNAMKKTWPEKPLAGAWTGDVATAEASLRIEAPPAGGNATLAWGEPVDGLRAAVELRNPTAARAADAGNVFPLGGRAAVFVHVQNVGRGPIAFWSEAGRQDDAVTLVGPDGKEKQLGHAWYSGWPRMEHWKLKPGETAVLTAIGIGFAADEEAGKKFDHPIGAVVVGKPGEYRLRYSLRFGGMERRAPDGKRLVPGEGDWQGTLVSGLTTVRLRERRPTDDPPTFTARLRFQGPDGKAVEAGRVDVHVQSGMRELLKTDLKPGTLEVPNCPFQELAVDVRAPGYEEDRYYDVAVRPGQVTTLTLRPASPLRLRLTTREGRPVVGAKVRYFNRSAAGASAGPYPSHGLTGPVWATSAADGRVVLDALQKAEPDSKLGDNIYWFYVEPPGLAPLFVGPVRAGDDLGNVTVGPLLEVSGEVRGTPAELEAFAAEWDQPEPMKRGNGEVGWHYAESKPLSTELAGDRLTFRLGGLRPGKLRVVARFRQGGKSVSHVYSRREPNEDDVVFEFDLAESRHDLVIANRPRASGDAKPVRNQ